MATYTTKVYIVQQCDREGRDGAIIAVKLIHSAARQLARDYAPAKVITAIADKTIIPNIAEH